MEFVRATVDDEEFLWLMLTFAASMDSPGENVVALAKADKFLRMHVEGWGRAGDLGIIAVRNNERIGAAWIRLGAHQPSELKLGDSRIPELAIAVLPDYRGKGVGSRMLGELLNVSRSIYPGIVLSVREDNPAVALYRRVGFRIVDTHRNRVGGVSLVMRIDL